MRPARLLWVVGIPAVVCALWTIHAGKDVNWDLLNYHYYGPYQLLDGRLGKDFFAASAQGYLNPLGHLPFYLMVSAGWHSVIASVVLAAAASVAIGLLYLIAWQLYAHHPLPARAAHSALAAALGAATVVFWATAGSSFLDPLLVVPMLGGLLLLLGSDAERAVRRAAVAGVLFGAAAALKYSNALYALAALPLAFAMTGVQGARRLHCGIAYGAGGALAVGALAGPWMAMMAREFGNPAFPFLSRWFPSPYIPPVNYVTERFAPKDWIDALSLPFRMALPDRVYVEILAPDLRPALLVLALAALAALGRLAGGRQLGAADRRLLGFFAAAWVLWVATSANGRYGLLVLLLAGVCLARLTDRLLPPQAVLGTLGLVLLAQLGMSAHVSTARWALADRWSAEWLPYRVPEQARREPALYLTVETLPMAVIVPFVHPASSFINLRGQYSVVPGWAPVERLFARHQGRVRVLGRALRLQAGGGPSRELIEAIDPTLLRFGYRINAQDCFAIPWRPPEEDWLARAANWLAGEPAAVRPTAVSLASCGLVRGERDPRDVAEEKRVSALFDRIEQACPTVFRGQRGLTEPLGKEWSRNYQGLEARLETLQGRVGLVPHLSVTGVDLGALADWERDPAFRPAACR